MSIQDKFVNSADDAKNDTKEFGEKLKNSAMDAGQAFKDQLVASGRETLDTASDMKNGLFEWVKANPGKTIGLAFFAGWLFSKKN